MIKYDDETKTLKVITKDTGSFGLKISNYSLDEGDTIYFTVNEELEKPTPRIQKIITEFTDHQAIINLTSEDTNIPVGKYYYDIQVNTADGRVDTIVGPYKFLILGGVTY